MGWCILLGKVKTKLFNLDDEKLKPYFQLEKYWWRFHCKRKIIYYFRRDFDIDKYNDEVTTYEVKDIDDQLVAILRWFFPRKKRNGAWMTSYKSQFIKEGLNERPHISIVCNFESNRNKTVVNI
jgi:peptidyl-dipeptidase Dcp